MIVKQNKLANPWIRLLATIIDNLIFLSIFLAVSFLVFDYQKSTYRFSKYFYYLWLSSGIILIIINQIVLPVFLKGKSIGMLICKIHVLNLEHRRRFSKAVFDRSRLFGFLWLCIICFYVVLISPETFIKISQVGFKKEDLNLVQKIFFAIPLTLTSFGLIVQVVFVISNFSTNRIGWNDKFSNTRTVWDNKFDEIEEDDNVLEKIIPIKRVLPKIEFEN
ncbi:RDD family protein [Metamycoplasma subdolum]|uniref:RDD family protein n=1 Tax=Metamycoplasma subdolum TaxID=92407 RepID=A0A3M0A4V4_9BACT|nr:RDD family protein [Metamycoplasma subdolum]RMA78529.1 RDD family protein [Metamycoplasma subdolum]WPB50461.1 RDD family protein [Metamycoplasma subdolum]